MTNVIDKQLKFLENERLIYLVMKKYFPYIFSNLNDREEYYQVGSIGLLKAIDNYDSNKSAFSTYACSMIWGEIKRNIRDSSKTIKFSRKIIDIANRIIASYYTSNQSSEFTEYVNNYITYLDISVSDRLGIMAYIEGCLNIDTPVKEKDDITIGDMIASSNSIADDVIYTNYLDNIANKLSNLEKEVFKYFLEGKTQPMIAKLVDYSQPHISRIINKIRILGCKELCYAGNYDSAFIQLFNICHNSESQVKELCRKYQIDFDNCPTKLLNEENKNMMQSNNEIVYGKKICQKLILKCMMKLILSNKYKFSINELDNNEIKNKIKKLLINYGYDNESIFKHLNTLVSSQIKSCISLAQKTIDKYNYSFEYEIVVDELDFKSSKFIKTTNSPMYNSNNHEKATNHSENIITNIISLLNGFRRDNLAVRF